jgi:hypothetical protein
MKKYGNILQASGFDKSKLPEAHWGFLLLISNAPVIPRGRLSHKPLWRAISFFILNPITNFLWILGIKKPKHVFRFVWSILGSNQ